MIRMRILLRRIYKIMWIFLVTLLLIVLIETQLSERVSHRPNPTAPSNFIINPHDFDYIINNESLCDNNRKLAYLIYVHSRPTEWKERDVFRRTWAQKDLFKKYPSRLVFFLGNPNDETVLEEVKRESLVHGDIVMEDFVDSYRNLTYKAIAALKWIDRYCLNTKFAIKVDQDTYVNIFRFIFKLFTTYVNEERFFLGRSGERDIHRIKKGNICKWCIPDHIMPGIKKYPKFCYGVVFAYPAHLATELYNASLITPFFRFDDVYVTGILRDKLKIRIFNVRPKDFLIRSPSSFVRLKRKNVLVIHGGDTESFWTGQLRILPTYYPTKINITHGNDTNRSI